MDPDLMGTACLQRKGDEAVPIFCLLDMIVRDGPFSVRIDRTFQNTAGFSSERFVDRAGRGLRHSPDYCQVVPADRVAYAHL